MIWEHSTLEDTGGGEDVQMKGKLRLKRLHSNHSRRQLPSKQVEPL